MNKVAVDSDLVYGKLKLHEANQLLGLEEEYTLHQTDHCIGRNPEDANGEPQFVINTPYISGTHCRLYVANPDQSQTPGAEADLSVFLEDLSSNGTHINGKAVGKRKTIQLNNEDVIQLYKPRAKRGSKGAAPQAIVYQFFAFPEGLTSKAQAKRRQKLSAKRASPGKRKAASGMKPPPPKRAAVSERQQATKPGADAQLLRKMESKVKEEKEKSAKAEEKNTKLEKKVRHSLEKFQWDSSSGSDASPSPMKQHSHSAPDDISPVRNALFASPSPLKQRSSSDSDISPVRNALFASLQDNSSDASSDNEQDGPRRSHSPYLAQPLSSKIVASGGSVYGDGCKSYAKLADLGDTQSALGIDTMKYDLDMPNGKAPRSLNHSPTQENSPPKTDVVHEPNITRSHFRSRYRSALFTGDDTEEDKSDGDESDTEQPPTSLSLALTDAAFSKEYLDTENKSRRILVKDTPPLRNITGLENEQEKPESKLEIQRHTTPTGQQLKKPDSFGKLVRSSKVVCGQSTFNVFDDEKENLQERAEFQETELIIDEGKRHNSPKHPASIPKNSLGRSQETCNNFSKQSTKKNPSNNRKPLASLDNQLKQKTQKKFNSTQRNKPLKERKTEEINKSGIDLTLPGVTVRWSQQMSCYLPQEEHCKRKILELTQWLGMMAEEVPFVQHLLLHIGNLHKSSLLSLNVEQRKKKWADLQLHLLDCIDAYLSTSEDRGSEEKYPVATAYYQFQSAAKSMYALPEPSKKTGCSSLRQDISQGKNTYRGGSSQTKELDFRAAFMRYCLATRKYIVKDGEAEKFAFRDDQDIDLDDSLATMMTNDSMTIGPQ